MALEIDQNEIEMLCRRQAFEGAIKAFRLVYVEALAKGREQMLQARTK